MKYVKSERGALPVLVAILAIVVVAVVGVAVYNVNKSRQTDTQTVSASPSPANSPAAAASPVDNRKTYTNDEFGLTFKYPSEYGEVTLVKDTQPNAGPRFTGQFAGNAKLRFIVTSASYGEDEGSYLIKTFRGHYESGGKTYYKWAHYQNTGATPVLIGNPVKTLSVGGRKVLIVNDSSMVHIDGPAKGPGPGNVAGLVNLGGSTYPGVVFITSMPADELEQILSSLKI